MLVCNVSLRPPRLAIAVDIAEAVTAADATATGNIVFATLVDDPANVLDIVDAYSGEIMLEVASANSSQDAVVPGIYAVAVDEIATAAELSSASVALPFTTFDAGGTMLNVTLSAGNNTVTSTTTSGGARSIAYKTTGKYYFEFTLVSWSSGPVAALGVVSSTGTYVNMRTDGTNSTDTLTNSGAIFSNNGYGGVNIGVVLVSEVVCFAIDLDNRMAWFRRNGGNWNASGTANPATNVGGIVMQATVSFAPAVAFLTANGTDKVTANFGGSAFAFAVPSGFTAGWPT